MGHTGDKEVHHQQTVLCSTETMCLQIQVHQFKSLLICLHSLKQAFMFLWKTRKFLVLRDSKHLTNSVGRRNLDEACLAGVGVVEWFAFKCRTLICLISKSCVTQYIQQYMILSQCFLLFNEHFDFGY